MALKKQLELDSGAVGEYWRITEIVVNRLNDTASVEMFLYVDEAARGVGKSPLSTQRFRLQNIDLVVLSQTNPVAAAYAKLKELDTFTDAEDV